MMTRKHFVALAEALKAAEPQPPVLMAVWDQWRRDCEAIARACKAQNPGFNTVRFLEACGL